ncbi:hypothetical protein ACKZDW_08145 [Ralstonia syzygii subsp. celebesensis]|nr:hypothetical protein [Ralstonia syzygii]
MTLIARRPASKHVIDLNGPDGNAWCLLGNARQIAKAMKTDFEPIRVEMMSGDYRHLVETFDKHFGQYVDLILPNNWNEYRKEKAA